MDGEPTDLGDDRAVLGEDGSVTNEETAVSLEPEPSRRRSGLLTTPAQYQLGQSVGGATLKSVLGSGGMGAVYLADRPDGGQVAVKVILPCKDTAASRTRFRQEAKVQESLGRHANLVDFIDSGEEPFPWIQFEYVEGRTLRDGLAETGSLSPHEAIGTMIKVLKGLEWAHARTVIHRDLKPANILVGKDGRVAIADFGLGRVDNDDSEERLTLTGHFAGTALYVSPEQSKDVKRATHLSDLYSVGAILFHLLAAQPPFRGSRAELVNAHRKTPAPSLAGYCDGLPESLIDLVQRCLAKSPDARPKSARAVREELERILPELERPGDTIKVDLDKQIDEWQLEAVIGSGQLGKVLRARCGETVAALKVLQLSAAGELSDAEASVAETRFQREIGLSTKLNAHPNIINVFGSGEAMIDGRLCPYFVMELAHSDLRRRIAGPGGVSEKEALAVGVCVGKALAHAHEEKAVHRDVKPANILIVDDEITPESIRLSDFGVAGLMELSDGTTRTGAIGSAHYMSPEQARSRTNIDGRADVYALGATLFHLLTGRKLFNVSTGLEAMKCHCSRRPDLVSMVTPRLGEPRLSNTLNLLVDFALLKEASDRPSMADWVADLEAYSKQELSAERVGEIRRWVRWVRFKEWLLRHGPALLAGTGLVAAVLFVVMAARGSTVDDAYRTARENLVSLQSGVRQFSDSANLERLNRIALQFESFEASMARGRRSGEPVPQVLESERRRFRDWLNEREATRIEDLAAKLLIDPGGDDAIRHRDGIATIRSRLVVRLADSSSSAQKSMGRRLETIKNKLEEADAARSLIAAFKDFATLVNNRQWEEALAHMGSETAGPSRALDRFAENFGKRSAIYETISGRVDRLADEAKSELARLDEQLASLAAERQTTSNFKGFQDRVNAFLTKIPAGNSSRQTRAGRLARQENPIQVAARHLLESLRERMSETTDDRWDYPGLLDDIATLRGDDYHDLPEFQDAGLLERTVRSACDRTARASFEAFLARLRASFNMGVVPQSYDDHIESAGEWPKADRRLVVWTDLKKARESAVDELTRARSDYAERLLARAEQTFDERGPGLRFDDVNRILNQPPTAADVRARLERVKTMIGAVRQWPGFGAGSPADSTLRRLKAGVTAIETLHTRMKKIPIPGGAVPIGNGADTRLDHAPQHQVKLSPFLIDRFEVSVADYGLFLKEETRVLGNERHRPGDWDVQLETPTLPVRHVSLGDARAYAAWAGKRLPTEFEWETAARRAGGPFPWGKKSPDTLRARFGVGGQQPVAVDAGAFRKGCTPEGLFHVAGNVEEWTASVYRAYPGGSIITGQTAAGAQVVRGGNYESDDFLLEVWRRFSANPGRRDGSLGFRCAASP